MTAQQEIALKSALSLDGYQIAIMPEALAAKAELVASASQVLTVTNDAECVVAKTWIGRLAALRIDVEKTRKKLKEIPLEIGRTIDAAAASFLREPTSEEERLKRKIACYAAEVAVAAEAARREQAGLAAEAEAERRRQAAAELARLAAIAKAQADLEQAAKAAQAAADAAAAPDSDTAADIAAADAWDAAHEAAMERAEIERQNAAAAAQERANAALAASEAEKARQAASATVAGASQYWDYEMVNPRALIQHCFDTGAQYADTVIRRSDILAALKAYPIDGEPPVIPGLSIVRKVRVR